MEQDVLAQIRELIAENQRLRQQGSPDATCGAGAPASQVEEASEYVWSHRLSTALLFLTALSFFTPLGVRLWKEWQVFVDLVKTQPKMRQELASFVGYRFDVWVTTTPRWREIILVAFTLFVVLVGGLLYSITSGGGLGESMFAVWIFLVDTGAHAEVKEGAGMPAWLVALLATVCGLHVFALLISLLTERLQNFLEHMQKGRSRVLCSGHVVILGWSDKIPIIVEELAEANVSEGGGTIAILAEGDKTELEAELQSMLDNSQSVYRGRGLRGTTWAVRSGNPMLISDLKLVSASLAKAIIVLADSTLPSNMADEKTLRTLLGLVGLDHEIECEELENDGTKRIVSAQDMRSNLLAPNRWERKATMAGESGPDQHIVVELTDIDSVPLVEALGSKKAEIVVSHDMAGQLLIQGSRQEGLAQIYESIVGFEGCEFYIEGWPQLVGLKYEEVAFAFESAIVVGIVTGEGHLLMNPANDYVVEMEDRVVVLAEDNDTYSPAEDVPLYGYSPGSHRTPPAVPEPGPEHILICGWRRDLGDMISELEAAVGPESSLTLMSEVKDEDREARLSENERKWHKNLHNLKLINHVGDPTCRKDLERLPIQMYDSLIVVSDEELESNANAMAADGRAIATMLLVLDIRRGHSINSDVPVRVTSELRDTRTRHLIKATGLSDYIMSQNIVAAVIANIAESREVNGIMREILTSQGNSIFLPSAEAYLNAPDEQICFWELSARCRDSYETLLGFREADDDIVLNPENRHEARSWTGCTLVILALNRTCASRRPSKGPSSKGN